MSKKDDIYNNNYKYLTIKEKNKIIKDIASGKFVKDYYYDDIMNDNINIFNSFSELSNYYYYNYDFLNYSKRNDYIIQLIYNAIDTYDNECIAKILDYFKYEKKIKEQREKENYRIEVYQKAIDDLTISDSLNIDDLDAYFTCLDEALSSYDEKEFNNNYSFYSEEMNNSVHRGLNMDLSIPKGELPHLLGVRNPNYDEDDIILNMYNNFLKANNFTHSDDNYIKYLNNNFKSDLRELINNNRDNKELKEFITKSFNKCLTFIKVYEYKRIPEIIVDYQISKGYNKTFKDHTKDLITKANRNDTKIDDNALVKLLDIDFKKITKKDFNMLLLIRDKFTKDLDKVCVKYDSVNDTYDLGTLIVNDVIYKYKKNNYWAELNPDIFLVSYNTKEYKKQSKILDKYLKKAINLLSAKLKFDLKIPNTNAKKNDDDLEITDSKRNRLINLDTIKNAVISMDENDCHEYEQDFDIVCQENCKKSSDDDEELSKEDYDHLKAYMKSIFGELNNDNPKDRINNYFAISDNINEQPHIRMIQRIMDKLMRRSKTIDYPKPEVSIIGFGTVRDSKYGKFKEKFAKTLMGKTFLQLEYDLRRNGYSYKLNGIIGKYQEKNIYYNYDLLIDDDKIGVLLNKLEKLNDKINKNKYCYKNPNKIR